MKICARSFAPLVLILALGASACGLHFQTPISLHPPATVVTAAGQTAWTADQIVTRVREFQTVVIKGSDGGAIPVATAREIVSWTVASLKVIKATPDGWQATVRAGWAALRDKVAAVPAVAAWVPTIDMMIGFVVGQPTAPAPELLLLE